MFQSYTEPAGWYYFRKYHFRSLFKHRKAEVPRTYHEKDVRTIKKKEQPFLATPSYNPLFCWNYAALRRVSASAAY
jgi:hypothetical protein